MTYPIPAIRPASDGKDVEITPAGLRIICDQLKQGIPAGVDAMRNLTTVEHRYARGHLRNLLDLIDALEVSHGIR